MFETIPIQVQVFNEIAVISFIRPEIKNPLSVKTLEILSEKFNYFDEHDNFQTIVFTGSGNTFAAGANLNEVAKLNDKTAIEFGILGQNLMQSIYRSKKHTIAAIDGFCMGGALDLALSCKRRFASPKSFFAHPGAKLGIITGWSGTQILPRLIGKHIAIELLITAKRIDANEALRIGLIDKIIENPLAKTLETF